MALWYCYKSQEEQDAVQVRLSIRKVYNVMALGKRYVYIIQVLVNYTTSHIKYAKTVKLSNCHPLYTNVVRPSFTMNQTTNCVVNLIPASRKYMRESTMVRPTSIVDG